MFVFSILDRTSGIGIARIKFLQTFETKSNDIENCSNQIVSVLEKIPFRNGGFIISRSKIWGEEGEIAEFPVINSINNFG